MSNKVKEIDIKNQTYYFFDDIINIKNFNPSNIKRDEKSYKNILIHYIRYVTIKDSKYVKINIVKNNVSFYQWKHRKNKKYKEMWIKIKDLIRSLTKNSDNYDEKYMKIKFNSDDELPLNKTIEIPTMKIVLKAIFYENNKFYPQVLLYECLYKSKII